MATLHLISCRMARPSELWQQLQAALAPDDALLFLGAGIYNLATPLPVSQALYVLQADVAATGFQPAAPVTIIDYEAFVGLGVRYERSLGWS